MRFWLPILLLFVACNKEEPQKTPDLRPGFFTGARPVNVVRTPFPSAKPLAELVISVYFENTDPPQRGEMQVTGLPAGIKSSFSVAAGTNSFSSTLTLLDAGVANGTYSADVEVLTKGNLFDAQPLKISISGESNCAAYFLSKKFTATNSCNPGALYTVYFTRLGGNGDTLLLQNFKGDGTAIKIFLRCDAPSGFFEIMPQVIGNLKYQGGYTYQDADTTNNTLEVFLSQTGPAGTPQSCNYIFKAQP